LQCFLREFAGGDGRFVTRTRLIQGDDGVLDVDADLADRLLQLQLALAHLELVSDVVALRGAVAEGNVQLESDRIIGIVAAEKLTQQIAITTPRHKDRVHLYTLPTLRRVRRSAEGIVGEVDEGLQRGQQVVFGTQKIDAAAFEIDSGLLDFGTGREASATSSAVGLRSSLSGTTILSRVTNVDFVEPRR